MSASTKDDTASEGSGSLQSKLALVTKKLKVLKNAFKQEKTEKDNV